MAVFRVQKTKDFTVMSNHHLKNKDLSLRAKGLLSVMLSLPEEWDYTLKGLAQISKEGLDAVRATVRELEAFGYVERRRMRNAKGQLTDTEYLIHEFPILSEPIYGGRAYIGKSNIGYSNAGRTCTGQVHAIKY